MRIKLMLFGLLLIIFASCISHPRPYKNWYKNHSGIKHYNRGHNVNE